MFDFNKAFLMNYNKRFIFIILFMKNEYYSSFIRFSVFFCALIWERIFEILFECNIYVCINAIHIFEIGITHVWCGGVVCTIYKKRTFFVKEWKKKRLKQEIARKCCLRRKLIQSFFCGEQGVKLIRIRGTGRFGDKID